MAEVSRWVLLRVFVRSLALQASWSFRGLQSLGFAYAMEPALERIYPAAGDRRLALQRHLGFFNSNPVLAAAILGCAVRMEELLPENAGGEGIP